MAPTPTPHAVTWKYNDWRQQSSDPLKLQRLYQHIQEVEGFALQVGSKSSSIKLDEGYLARLEEHANRLERQINVNKVVGARPTGVAKFVRGSGS